MSKMTMIRLAVYAILIALSPFSIGNADGLRFKVCELVSSEQLAALYPSTLYADQKENGCRWSDTPRGTAFFQIGIMESQKNLRHYFEKEIPANYKLKRINDLGDRGLLTESKGYLSVIAIREGSWILISTVDLLYIKQGDERQKMLWDIYRGILQSLE
jgi:hypothetical protein